MDETAAAFADVLHEVFSLLEQGCVPRQIDRALIAAGWKEGPFSILDTMGLDLFRARWMVPADGRRWSAIPDLVLAMGRLGRKTGAGFYLYTKDFNAGLRDPEIEAMIVAHSKTIGTARREIGSAEIAARIAGRQGAAPDTTWAAQSR